MNEVTSPTRFSSPVGGRTDAGDRGARGLDKLRRLLERECEAQVGELWVVVRGYGGVV